MAATDAATMMAADFMVIIAVVWSIERCYFNQFMSVSEKLRPDRQKIIVTW